jgi:hypothetical protein
MSHVYIVVATKDADVETCESFAGATQALGRAFQLSSDKSGVGRTDLFNPSPKEEVMTDGSTRWVFMNTNKQSVVVTYRKVESSLLSQKDPMSVLPPLTVAPSAWVQPITTPSFSDKYLPVYSVGNPVLPAGWSKAGTPVLMREVLDGRSDLIDPFTLSEAQKWALITARIRKCPNYNNQYSRLDSRDILLELKKKSFLGLSIRDIEIEELHVFHQKLLDKGV